LPACAQYTRVPIQYPVRISCNSGVVRGKVPINTDLSSLLLVPQQLLPACASYTWVPIQYPESQKRARVRGKVPINMTCQACCWSLITAAVLPGVPGTQVPIQYPVRDFAAGLVSGSQSILTCRACCWSLITAAVACLLLYWVPIHPVRDFNRGSLKGPNH
jgi:hypothetical protein